MRPRVKFVRVDSNHGARSFVATRDVQVFANVLPVIAEAVNDRRTAYRTKLEYRAIYPGATLVLAVSHCGDYSIKIFPRSVPGTGIAWIASNEQRTIVWNDLNVFERDTDVDGAINKNRPREAILCRIVE